MRHFLLENLSDSLPENKSTFFKAKIWCQLLQYYFLSIKTTMKIIIEIITIVVVFVVVVVVIVGGKNKPERGAAIM